MHVVFSAVALFDLSAQYILAFPTKLKSFYDRCYSSGPTPTSI
jgi:hypothetical protein